MLSPPSGGGNLTVRLTFLAAVLLVAGCETLSFYSQAARGQWQVLNRAEPVSEVISAPGLSEETKRQLALAQEALVFAEQHLRLDVGKRYRRYADLERTAVVWNVFAAQPLDLGGKRWCYPVAGCTSYRGFFREAAAHRYARRMVERGWETYVGAVPAYSTLGWFDDPILSTFIHWPEPDLVSLLFHELAHGRIWVKDDVSFNEGFASFVGEAGLRAWMGRRYEARVYEDYLERRKGQRQFRQFLVRAKTELTSLYARTDLNHEEKLAGKEELIAAVLACYDTHRSALGGGRFDTLMHERFNNAYLVSVGTYEDRVPAFRVLFEQSDGWEDFYRRVEALADLEVTHRERELSSLEDEKHQHTDDTRPDEVHCEAFPGHGAD